MYTPIPVVSATAMPLTRPVSASLPSTTGHWRRLISRSTRPRIVTASACAPALPDCPATTGSSTASAVNCEMTPSNRPTTAAARKAVSRLICSHGRRLRTANAGVDSARSSGLAPTMVWMSRLDSSSTAAISSAWRITPTKRPARLTTGSVVIGCVCSVSHHLLARVEVADEGDDAARDVRQRQLAQREREVLHLDAAGQAALRRRPRTVRARRARRIWRSRSIASATVMPVRSGLTRGSIMRPAQSSG